MIVNLDESAFKAFITVTYPSGTCTLSHESGASYTHSGGGTHTFVVHRRGKWNIRAEDGTMVKEASAEISARGQIKTVVLSYELVLFDRSLASGYSLNGHYISPAIDLSQYAQLEVTGRHADIYGTLGMLLGFSTAPESLRPGNYLPKYIEFYSTVGTDHSTKSLNIDIKDKMYFIMCQGGNGGAIVDLSNDFSISNGMLTCVTATSEDYISKIVLR